MIKASEQITELAKALNKVQQHVLEVSESETNPFYNSKYAPLEAIWRIVRKPMTDAGLSISQFPSTSDGKAMLTSILMHTSGQWIQSEIELNPAKKDPQGMGAAITYYSRFMLKAILGVSTVGADQDGNDAVTPPPVSTKAKLVIGDIPKPRMTASRQGPPPKLPKSAASSACFDGPCLDAVILGFGNFGGGPL